MDKIVSIISGISGVRSQNNDDFSDRLSSRYSVVLLVMFAILNGMNQYVRNPITCWAPVHFTGPHTKFATSYCWIKNTYYLPWESEVPRLEEHRQMIPYYQWIPFILIFQAILFYMPNLIWHSLNSKAGIDADNIMSTAHTISKTDSSDAQKRAMLLLTNQMDRFLSNRVPSKRCNFDPKSCLSSTCCRLCGRRLGNYFLLLFLFSKVCYIANVVCQLFFLNSVLSIKYNTFGFDIIRNMVSKDDWSEESYVAFPRVTFCDFQIRGQDLANVQTYTVQCVLPINLYNEKIYLFLWFWMIFVLAMSLLHLILWIVRSLIFKDRVKFIVNHLYLGNRVKQPRKLSTEQQRAIEEFTRDYLKQDGSFLLRLIAHNTNNLATTDVVSGLWDFWIKKYKTDKVKEVDVSPLARLYPFPHPLGDNIDFIDSDLKLRNS